MNNQDASTKIYILGSYELIQKLYLKHKTYKLQYKNTI